MGRHAATTRDLSATARMRGQRLTCRSVARVEPTHTDQTGSEGDGWHDLPAGAEPFTPAQMILDRSFFITDFMPDSYDTPGHGYAEPGRKIRSRRRLESAGNSSNEIRISTGGYWQRRAEDGVGADEDSREDDSGSDQT